MTLVRRAQQKLWPLIIDHRFVLVMRFSVERAGPFCFQTQSTLDVRANSNANPLMLLACSVNTPPPFT